MRTELGWGWLDSRFLAVQVVVPRMLLAARSAARACDPPRSQPAQMPSCTLAWFHVGVEAWVQLLGLALAEALGLRQIRSEGKRILDVLLLLF
mmetsp:Transcript_30304/g.78291  ORF Transcript_30304/g.78291 Transcript_30304/m.78291 type:complete len:93 (-) Transcript_30304:6-284(-)